MNERWEQIDNLFHAALEREPSQRTRFLAQACDGDEPLREEVESLLAAHEQASSFIESPPADIAADLIAENQTKLAAGQAVGPYKIVSLLGTGGMGEVYLAQDARLSRRVALKLLPAGFTEDQDRARRFEREAHTASVLNHPNIVTIHEIGKLDGAHFIITEFIEGKTLRQRMAVTRMKLRQAIDVAIQVASALAAAHKAGIVHRDIKPENIMLRPDGLVKVLDFGLAKLTEPQTTSTDAEASTLVQVKTESGLVMGTVTYMSPEQARGQDVDARTDIFSFGVLLYEMIAGRAPFEGATMSDIMAAILKENPAPLTQYAHQAPVELDWIVQKALAKNREERYQAIKELQIDLKRLSQEFERQSKPDISQARLHNTAPIRPHDTGTRNAGAGDRAAISARLKNRERLIWIVTTVILLAGLLATLLFAIGRFQQAPPDARTMRFVMAPPENSTFSLSSAISPDGRLLAFAAVNSDGKRFLWLRSMDSLTVRLLEGTENGSFPFWSPDSRYVGFFVSGKLRKIDASGGSPQTLCDAPNGLGGSWNSDGVIIFARNFSSSIYRVSAAGGQSSPVTSLDESRQEKTHRFPRFLPDGRRFLYLARGTQPEHSGIYVGSLDSKETTRLLSDQLAVAYAPPGYLLFVREGKLMAQTFDADKLQLTGEPVVLAEKVLNNFSRGISVFSVSNNGVLTYRSDTQDIPITWYDRAGNRLSAIDSLGDQRHIKLSPDEKRLAYERFDPQTGGYDIWLLELSSNITTRFTFDHSDEGLPVWSPDGSRIIFAVRSSRDKALGLYQKLLGGAGDAELIFKAGDIIQPTDWSKDGQFVVYHTYGLNGSWDIWVMPLFGDRKPFPFMQTDFNEHQGQVSPDGRWIAYSSDESGQFELYVQTFPAPGEKYRVSTGSGGHPRWRRDGKELFYIAADGKLMSVEVKYSPAFKAAPPQLLFDTRTTVVTDLNRCEITADGKRFLINPPPEMVSNAPTTVVLNWTAELKR